MKSPKSPHTASLPVVAACAALLSVFAAAPTPARAQARGEQPHRPPQPPKFDTFPPPPSVRERQFVMEGMMRDLYKGAQPRKTEESWLSEVAEDYRDLQQVNNKMMAATMRAAAPDYELINKSAADINRRAERLRENLALPAPAPKDGMESEPQPAEDAAGMKAALLALDRSIMSFVRSPLFKNKGVIDIVAAAKASRDLAEVIERSRLARSDAARLSKKSKN